MDARLKFRRDNLGVRLNEYLECSSIRRLLRNNISSLTPNMRAGIFLEVSGHLSGAQPCYNISDNLKEDSRYAGYEGS